MGEAKIPDLIAMKNRSKRDYIEALYRTLLLREVDEIAAEELMSRDDADTLFASILVSEEFRSKVRNPSHFPALRLSAPRPRVLLIGAYGNGNLGDKIQADSLRHIIGVLRPDLEVWAGSASPASYPFPFDRTLSVDMLDHAAIANQFNLLIVGGGGLLSHPHDPLTGTEWQTEINTQVAIAAVGANSDVIAQSEILVKKAAFVSVRDDHSLDAMRPFRPDVEVMLDPVLCDPRYLGGRYVTAPSPSKAIRRLWILKAQCTEPMALFRERIDPTRDAVCFLEPHLDFPLITLFPEALPIYRLEELLSLIDAAEVVVSTRYHGCILALLRRRPCIALYEHKSLDLMCHYGLEQSFFRSLSEISFETYNSQQPIEEIRADQATFARRLRSILDAAIVLKDG